MKVPFFLALLGATSAWAAKASLSGVNRVTNLPIVSNKFIVEVAEASEIPTKRALGTVGLAVDSTSISHSFQPHELLYRSLTERKISFDVHKEFDAPGIFIGAVLTLNVCALTLLRLTRH